jgi:hypothetical protein
MSPPRSGMRRIIWPWEYRHLRAFGALRIFGGVVLFGLACVTLAFGGSNWTAYGWALGFGVVGLADLAFGCWELSVASTRPGPQDGRTGFSPNVHNF